MIIRCYLLKLLNCVSLSGLTCFNTDYLKSKGAVLGMVYRMMIDFHKIGWHAFPGLISVNMTVLKFLLLNYICVWQIEISGNLVELN